MRRRAASGVARARFSTPAMPAPAPYARGRHPPLGLPEALQQRFSEQFFLALTHSARVTRRMLRTGREQLRRLVPAGVVRARKDWLSSRGTTVAHCTSTRGIPRGMKEGRNERWRIQKLRARVARLERAVRPVVAQARQEAAPASIRYTPRQRMATSSPGADRGPRPGSRAAVTQQAPAAATVRAMTAASANWCVRRLPCS
jgi:hypothetical protein